MEVKHRNQTYYRILHVLNEADFIEACDRILFSDEWFPTIARIRTVVAECAADRNRSDQAVTVQPSLVCPYCHGARWVRTGGYDPAGMRAGETGSRVHNCPKCTTVGRHDSFQENHTIEQEGGVMNENAPKDVDLSRTTWRAPRAQDGTFDFEALYRESRIVRGLDPTVDARSVDFGSFRTVGSVLRGDKPERELVTAGADWSVDSDDIPF